MNWRHTDVYVFVDELYAGGVSLLNAWKDSLAGEHLDTSSDGALST